MASCETESDITHGSDRGHDLLEEDHIGAPEVSDAPTTEPVKSETVTAPKLPVPTFDELERLTWAEADGRATPVALSLLAAHPAYWRSSLERLIAETDEAIAAIKARGGIEAELALKDFEDDWVAFDRSLEKLTGPSRPKPPQALVVAELEDRPVQLQLSWKDEQVVAWAGGPNDEAEPVELVLERLSEAGAATTGWEEHEPVDIPDAGSAPAVSAPIDLILGWLVAVGSDPSGHDVGPSVHWLGSAAVVALRHVARGQILPKINRTSRSGQNRQTGGADRSTMNLAWTAAVIDQRDIDRLMATLPGSVTVLDGGANAKAVVDAVVSSVINAIATSAASRLEVPAPPPNPRTRGDVAEGLLARLDGSSFEAPGNLASEMGRRVEQWARPAISPKPRLIVELNPPDSSDGWDLKVYVPGGTAKPELVTDALVSASNSRRKSIDEQVTRLERLVPALLRSRRRGEVVLSQHEAWNFMTQTGEPLDASGFEVRFPALSRKRQGASLRLSADPDQETVVGAQQLVNVSWSAVFGDVELDVKEIQRLSLEARPMVKSRGKWIALEHADLAEAARAIAERADQTKMTGAAMLRHALGVEGTPFGGGVSLGGGGWASNLVESAAHIDVPDATPEGFVGELRSYQADAVAWLGFLDSAGLGGCLALDMGLGKTPTLLAHLRASRSSEPSLVIAPPAVVGNWAAEAAKFVPEMQVVVHHGPKRLPADQIARGVDGADLVITTYGTAMRDVEALAELGWDTVVLDEAQAIKNPASETAQHLRRIGSRTRVALTGTPIENGLGDLWAIMDYVNPDLVGPRTQFIAQLSVRGDSDGAAESALMALNGILVFRRTKAEPAIAAELPDRIDELGQCTMTTEQIGLYQAVLDELIRSQADDTSERKGQVLAAITALKQICNHPAAYQDSGEPLAGRSGKLARLEEIVDSVFAAGERILIFTHFAQWGDKLAKYLTERNGLPIACYHGGLARGARDKLVNDFQAGEGAGAMVLSLKAGGTGLNLTAASHVVLYDRWWNPAVEDQARDRVWRIGQTKTVIAHRLVCPGTVDERVEEVVAGKRKIADLVLPKSSSIGDLDAEQLRESLGLGGEVLVDDAESQALEALA